MDSADCVSQMVFFENREVSKDMKKNTKISPALSDIEEGILQWLFSAFLLSPRAK